MVPLQTGPVFLWATLSTPPFDGCPQVAPLSRRPSATQTRLSRAPPFAQHRRPSARPSLQLSARKAGAYSLCNYDLYAPVPEVR